MISASIHLSLCHPGEAGDFASHRSALRGRAARRENVHFKWVEYIVLHIKRSQPGNECASIKIYIRLLREVLWHHSGQQGPQTRVSRVAADKKELDL